MIFDGPRYVLIGYPGEHDTILAKSLLQKANIDFVFVYPDVEKHQTNRHFIKRFPAVRLIEATSMPIADGIDEIRAWLKAS